MFDGSDFQLAWPRDLFVSEASALLASGRASDDSRVGLLLEEAFVGAAALDAFRAAPQFGDDSPSTSAGAGSRLTSSQPRAVRIDHGKFLRTLVEHADSLPEASAPRPYWHERRGLPTPAGPGFTIDQAKGQFAQLIAELNGSGYLDNAFPKPCVDDADAVEPDHSALLYDRLGLPDLWPLRPRKWDDDTFFGLVEVFHDLVARPRNRHWHQWNQCGWHTSSYAVTPARRLYTWKLNTILARTDLPLRLADSGEDAGRLVQVLPDDRGLLVERALHTPDSRAAGQIQHAIALFRGRTATSQDRRSAVVALGHVLESRRALLKQELLKGDEGALFQIANTFAIRHERDDQKPDYDPIFLDWIFWWYLATIELSDRLLERSSNPVP